VEKRKKIPFREGFPFMRVRPRHVPLVYTYVTDDKRDKKGLPDDFPDHPWNITELEKGGRR